MRFEAAEGDSLTAYVRKRYRVLFELWCSGESECRVTFLACDACGFVLYSPRPTEADLDGKYRFLVGLTADDTQDNTDGRSDAWRIRDLHRQLRPFLPAGRPARILDFGGGDGRLLANIQKDGHECAIVDWCDKPVEGIRWLGDGLEDIDASEKFDIIVASHVIEHVVRPREVLEKLGRLLAPNGIVYVEVPLEIWGRPPLIAEPVTHVNFFVPGSLVRLLRNSGSSVERCKLGVMRQADSWTKVIRAVARFDFEPKMAEFRSEYGAAAEIDRFLTPTLTMRLHQRLVNPETWTESIGYRVRRMLNR